MICYSHQQRRDVLPRWGWDLALNSVDKAISLVDGRGGGDWWGGQTRDILGGKDLNIFFVPYFYE
jgi:hypothetical protein